MALISIIVPFYNVSSYLDACIASIHKQTYTVWELLLIDDGSTDDSAAIAHRWAGGDDRIKLYHKANGGVSTARNLGLDRASGQYVMFVDSDDICHSKLLETLYSFTESFGITMCDCARFQSTPGNNELCERAIDILLNQGDLYNCMSTHGILHAPFAKLYRRDVIENNGIRFKTGLQLGEDVLFNLNYLEYISTGVYINLPLYYYRDTPSSLSKKIENTYTDIQLMILSEKMDFTSHHNIPYNYIDKAPSIVRDIAMTILRSDAPREWKIDCLKRLRRHRIMEYCKTKGSFSTVVLAKAIKILPLELIVRLF